MTTLRDSQGCGTLNHWYKMPQPVWFNSPYSMYEQASIFYLETIIADVNKTASTDKTSF